MADENIRPNLHQRIRDIFGLDAVPDPLGWRGSVQPTIDFHKIMEKAETIIISLAGNVTTTITPSNDEKIVIPYGELKLVNDATVANRYIEMKIRDPDANVMTQLSRSALTASQTGGIGINPFTLDEGVNIGIYTISAGTNGVPIWNPDELYIGVNGGVAGDALTGTIKTLTYPAGRET